MNLDKIDLIACRIANIKKDRLIQSNNSSSGAFVGKGKLTEYKGEKDSWILNQMENGVEKGIPLGRGKDGQWKLDEYEKREKLIASSIVKSIW